MKIRKTRPSQNRARTGHPPARDGVERNFAAARRVRGRGRPRHVARDDSLGGIASPLRGDTRARRPRHTSRDDIERRFAAARRIRGRGRPRHTKKKQLLPPWTGGFSFPAEATACERRYGEGPPGATNLYSSCRIWTGSTFAARHAGATLAATPTTTSRSATETNVGTSWTPTP